MSLELHSFPISPRGFKAVFAVEHLGLTYELKFVNLAAGDQHAPAFAALNPNRRMPVLVDGDYVLWESLAIIEYLAFKAGDETFLPQAAPARLQVTKWLYWDAAHWDPAIAILMTERVAKPMFRMGATDDAEVQRGINAFTKVAPILDAQLSRHAFVAGPNVTAADVALASPLTYAEQAGLPLSDFPNILRWRSDVEALPAWQRTVTMQRKMLASMKAPASAEAA